MTACMARNCGVRTARKPAHSWSRTSSRVRKAAPRATCTWSTENWSFCISNRRRAVVGDRWHCGRHHTPYQWCIRRSPSPAAVVNGVLYFGAQAGPPGGITHVQLWRTDGTVAGTRLAADPTSSGTFALIGAMFASADHVLLNTASRGAAPSTAVTAPAQAPRRFHLMFPLAGALCSVISCSIRSTLQLRTCFASPMGRKQVRATY